MLNPRNAIDEAIGYHYLGLHEDAWACLQSAPPDQLQDPTVAGFRLTLLLELQRWEEAASLARDAIEGAETSPEFYLMGAFAIRRSESLEAAYAFLLQGEQACRDEATWWFNMACYECQMGRFERLDHLLEEAFNREQKFRELARIDEDLAPWRDRA